VRIQTFDRDSHLLAEGSGFVVADNGVVATNHHVIRGVHSGKVLFGEGSTMCDYTIEQVVGADLESDLALLWTFPSREEFRKAKQAWDNANPGGKEFKWTYPFQPLALQVNELPPVGTKVYAIGAPLGLTNTLSEGLISGHREVDSSLTLLQTTAGISPGSSGGPLLSESGKVLGITTASLRGGQNLNFAIPAQRITNLVATPSQNVTLVEAGRLGLDLSKQPPDDTGPKRTGPTVDERQTRREAERIARVLNNAKRLEAIQKAIDDLDKDIPAYAQAKWTSYTNPYRLGKLSDEQHRDSFFEMLTKMKLDEQARCRSLEKKAAENRMTVAA
jgi:S1-C subfamily serine protease